MAGEPKIDPLLTRSIAQAMRDGGEVEAVFVLRPQKGEVYDAPDEVVALAQAVVQRAAAASGETNYKVNVFKYLQSFAVAGKAGLIQEILKQPEIASAVNNRQPGDPSIRPVGKGPRGPQP